MNHHLTYRPQTAQTPADSFRGGPCDTRDPRRSMNPLTGIWLASRTAPCYRDASPNGERHHPAAIVHCSLFIVHCPWSYTFSAKERDSETGLSYFGSRYYSSDLSIWLSVDPMAGKYPSVSPYVYCADNPVRLVDPNGDSVIIKIGFGMKESDLQEALNDLRIAAPNLNLIMEGDKLLIGEGGEYKTQYEKQLAEAILSDEFKSELTLEVLDVGVVGSYYGTCKEGDQYISHNSINLSKSQELEDFWGSVRGCGLMQEITEGFEMGKIAKREGLPSIEKAERTIRQKTIGDGRIIPDDKTGPQYHLYEEGHSKSTPQPGNRNAKPKNFFKPVDN